MSLLLENDPAFKSLPEKDKELILKTLDNLFTEKHEENISDLSIRFRKNFHKYFGNTLFDSDLSETEIRKLFQADAKQQMILIDEFAKRNKLRDLEAKIRNYSAPDDENQFLGLIQVWVIMINKGYTNHTENLIALLNSDSAKRFTETVIFQDFFTSLFDTSQQLHFNNTVLLRDVLRRYIRDQSYRFVIDRKTIQEIALQRLRQYCSTINEIDSKAFEYYYACFDKLGQGDNVILLDSASEIIQQTILKNPHAYLKFIVRPLYRPHDNQNYVFEPYIPAYFQSWANFEAFLRLQSLFDVNVKDLIRFYKIFKANDNRGFFTSEKIKWLEFREDGAFIFQDIEPIIPSQEQVQKDLLAGTWRNDWIAPDTGPGSEPVRINEDMDYYILNGPHVYQLRNISVDLVNMTLSFEKVATSPNENIRLNTDLKIETVDSLVGNEIDLRDNRNISITYTRIDEDQVSNNFN